MNTATVTIRTTNTTATIPANRLALHPAVFARLCAESSHPAGLGVLDELHITTTTDDAFRARAQTVADFVGHDCVALFSGEGIDGCDVWARCGVEAPATRTITIAVDSARRSVWGAVEGDDHSGAAADAEQHMSEPEDVDCATIQWPADEALPGGRQSAIRRALALAVEALDG